MGQGDSARDFDTSESMKNAGILDVFPIFHTARLGQKIRRSLQLPLCGVALELLRSFLRHPLSQPVRLTALPKGEPRALPHQPVKLQFVLIGFNQLLAKL